MHLAPAHARIDFDQLGSCGRVLALHMENSSSKTQRVHARYREFLEFPLLVFREQRRGRCPCLVEVWLKGGPIVSNCRISPLSLRHYHIDVCLAAVKVLLKQQ